MEHVENAAKEEEACIKRERFKREKMRRKWNNFPTNHIKTALLESARDALGD